MILTGSPASDRNFSTYLKVFNNMSVESSNHPTIESVRRSLSFNSSTSVEDQDLTAKKNRAGQTSEEHVSADMQLREECENLWQELNNAHAHLETRNTASLPRADEDDFVGSKVLERVLKVKEKKLQTQILALENQGLHVTSTNPDYIHTHLRTQLLTSIRQLEETLEIVKGQRKEVEEEIKREEDILKQHIEITNSLEMKIESLEQEKGTVSVTSQVKDLENQKKAAEVYLGQTMKKLGSFLSTNFPLPSSDDFKGTKKKGRRVDWDPNTRYIPLQQFIEDLMNMLYSKPHDPYIRIEDAHWPPYIELLLRSGIAQRHPQDCNLIRLVAFNR